MLLCLGTFQFSEGTWIFILDCAVIHLSVIELSHKLKMLVFDFSEKFQRIINRENSHLKLVCKMYPP